MNTIEIIILLFAGVIALGALIVLWNNRKKKKDGGGGFLEDGAGNKSSTRLFSFLVLLFLFMGDLMLLTLIAGNPEVININFLWFTLIFNVLMLVAIFVPKQLGKMDEIRQTLELMKNGNGDSNDK